MPPKRKRPAPVAATVTGASGSTTVTSSPVFGPAVAGGLITNSANIVIPVPSVDQRIAQLTGAFAMHTSGRIVWDDGTTRTTTPPGPSR